MVKRAARGADHAGGFSPDARALLREVALRGQTAVRLDADMETALLRSIVDATVGIFRAEAASIALLEESTGNLRFVVAAGAQGEPVVGLTIPSTQGLAGYVFSTGESIALSDPAKDPRFGRGVAESTGFMPRSILAVPLEDGDRTVGVLEVIDKLEGPFSMEDIGIASLFARQAATAIRVAARAREIRIVLADVLASDEATADDEAVRELVSAATRRHAGDDRFWSFVDAIAVMRHATPADRDLAIELLRVIGQHGAATSRDATGRRLRQRR